MLLNCGYFVLFHHTPLRLQEIAAMHSIMLATVSVGQKKLASAIWVWLKHFERSYSTLSCCIAGILSFFTPPLCVYSKLKQCTPLCLRWCLWVKRSSQVQFGFDWSILKEVIQLWAVVLRVFCPFSPHPSAFTINWSNALHYACDGVCGSKEARKCNLGLIEAFWKKLFNFMLLNCVYFVLFHPTPLRLQEIATMHSIMLAMGSVGQKKLAGAFRVLLKHFKRRYST